MNRKNFIRKILHIGTLETYRNVIYKLNFEWKCVPFQEVQDKEPRAYQSPFASSTSCVKKGFREEKDSSFKSERKPTKGNEPEFKSERFGWDNVNIVSQADRVFKPEGAAPVSLDIFGGYVEMFRYARRKLSPKLQGPHFDKSDMLNVLGMFLVNGILFDSHRMKVGHSFLHSFIQAEE